MPRSAALTAALALLSAVPPLAALAEDPCAGDVQRLCPEVKPGSGNVARCLRDKRDGASAACRERLDAEAARARRLVEEFGRTCGADVDLLCPDIEPGRGRVLGCLAQHELELSSACQAELRRLADARERIARVRQACEGDAKALCAGVPPKAGPLLECLEANASRLSAECGGAELQRAVEAAGIVDLLEDTARQDVVREALQILQGLDSVAFSRSQVLLQLDSYEGVAGKANELRFLFNPQLVFGSRDQYALQLKVPVKALFPWDETAAPRSGLGAMTTAVGWNAVSQGRVRHFLSLGVQWETASERPLGGPWAIQPAYAVALGLARWLSVTTQLAWLRSVASTGYPELNVLVLEPIVVANLPGRSFAGLDTKLGWDLADGSFIPLVKGMAGIFTDRRKSVSIAAWYQASLTSEAASRSYEYEVGLGLAYFFDR